jgi:hypothetical protein
MGEELVGWNLWRIDEGGAVHHVLVKDGETWQAACLADDSGMFEDWRAHGVPTDADGRGDVEATLVPWDDAATVRITWDGPGHDGNCSLLSGAETVAREGRMRLVASTEF